MKILIIKVGALGDVVRTSFIAQALKDKYRVNDAEIYWITDRKALPFFINNPYIDYVFTNENKKELKSTFFDLVINLEEDEENCKFSSSIKHEKFIGAFMNNQSKIDYTQESKYWFDMSMISKLGGKIADKLKAGNKKTHRQILGEIINVNWRKYDPFFRLTEYQRKMAKDFLRRHTISRSEIVIGINSGGADRWPKSLPVKKTAELINSLYGKYKARLVLFGGSNEIERNKKILELVKAPIIDTGCGNDLIEFPALLSICNIIISTDSLGLHIALALKRRTIALIGPTSFYEIDMYGIGEKMTSDSQCISCYKKECKSMNIIDIKKIVKLTDRLLKQKITLLITAYKEPNIGKAIESALGQNTHYQYDIIVSAPDGETISIAQTYAKKDKRLKIIKDPGKGKSYALNLLLKSIKSDIVILTDGDVWISNTAVEEICNLFLNPEVGVVGGKPVPRESKVIKYGYWANFLFESAHRMRKESFERNKFLECSAYLFAFRKNKLHQIPLDVAEDAVIPYYFWEKGYKIGYAEKAEVYLKNAENWKDWIKQKIRTGKAHETLYKYVDIETTPRAKTFLNEARGITWFLEYPKNFQETIWTIELIFARIYMWFRVFYDSRIKNKPYTDAWERVESTK